MLRHYRQVRGGVKPFMFRQWVACITIGAVLFGAYLPRGICQCEGRCCSDKNALFQAKSTVENKSCCCEWNENSESKPDYSCPCQCCNFQKSDVIPPKAVLPLQKPNFNSAWDAGIVLPFGFADISGNVLLLAWHRVLPPPPVPLHVLLCIFLN